MVEGGKQDLANQNTLQSPTNPHCCAHLHIFSLPSLFFVVVEPFQHLRRGAVFLSSVLRSWATMQGMTCCAVGETKSSGQNAYVISALFWLQGNQFYTLVHTVYCFVSCHNVPKELFYSNMCKCKLHPGIVDHKLVMLPFCLLSRPSGQVRYCTPAGWDQEPD